MDGGCHLSLASDEAPRRLVVVVVMVGVKALSSDLVLQSYPNSRSHLKQSRSTGLDYE